MSVLKKMFSFIFKDDLCWLETYKSLYELEKRNFDILCLDRRMLINNLTDVDEKLRVRRAMTAPFNEEEFFRKKRVERANKYLEKIRASGGYKRLDHVAKVIGNIPGVHLTIRVVDRQDPPRHAPVEINPCEK